MTITRLDNFDAKKIWNENYNQSIIIYNYDLYALIDNNNHTIIVKNDLKEEVKNIILKEINQFEYKDYQLIRKNPNIKWFNLDLF